MLDWPGFELDEDLDLPAHGVTALFGHSGSGKTTLQRCIAELERPPLGHLKVLANRRYGIKRSTGATRVSLDQEIELLGIGHLLLINQGRIGRVGRPFDR